MFESLRYDPTARRLLLVAGLLLALALALGAITVIGNAPPPATPLPPTPTATATATPRPTATATPIPTATVPQLDTPVPTDPPRADRAASPTAAAASGGSDNPTDLMPTPPAEGNGASAGSDGGPAVVGPPFLTPLARPIRYVAIGASDTVGVGATDPATQAWPAVLAAHLPADTRFTRAARGGIVLGDALKVEVSQAVAAKPTLITVWLAANDITRQVPLPTYQGQLDTLLTRLTGETRAQIVLLDLPDLSLVLSPKLVPGGSAELRADVQNWNRIIAATAAPYGDRVLVVDLFPQSGLITADSSVVSADGWHPSTTGYAAIGAAVYAQMQAAGLVGAP